jgi:hypothetical protein
MKTILAFVLLITLYACLPAEKDIKKTPAVMHYILESGYYVPVGNKAALEKSLHKSAENVIAYMKNNRMNPNNYFLIDETYIVSADGKQIMIPVRHYSSIERDFKAGKNAAELGQKHELDQQGNPDEKDGYLIQPAMTNKIVDFQPWK